MADVSQWSTTAASNNQASPDGAGEGWAPSAVNDWGRECMAALARWYSDTDGTLTTAGTGNAFTLTTNSTHVALADMPFTLFRLDRGNSGASTLNVDGLGAKAIEFDGAALVSGDLTANTIVGVAYNATSDAYDLFAPIPNHSAADLTTGLLPAARIAPNTVDDTKLTDVAEATVKGRAIAAGTGSPGDLTAAQVAAIVQSASPYFPSGARAQSINYTVVAADDGVFFRASNTITFTMLAAATAGDGFGISIFNQGTGTITIDGNAAETINGQDIIYLGPEEGCILVCDGSNWVGPVSRQAVKDVESISATETAVAADHGRLYSVSSGTFTVNTPAAADVWPGYHFYVVNTSTGTITIDPNGAETVNGDSTYSISSDHAFVQVVCDGTNWNAMGVKTASAATAGIVELATTTETFTGTDTTRAVTPDALANTVLVARFDGAGASRLDGNPGTSGWTISRSAAGIYTVTHGLTLSNTDKLFITGSCAGSGATQFSVTTETTSNFGVQTENNGSNTDTEFNIICWLAEA